MAQQKSEDRVVPEGGVTPVERAGSSTGGQGKAVPVEEQAVQLRLPIVTAENPKGATRRKTRVRLGEIRAGAPKAIDKTGMAVPVTMEEVAERLTDALLMVASNKGAPGPDGRTIEVLADQWPVVLSGLRADLLAGRYVPGGIRRVFIPKAGGGQRGLGIPDVIDRVVQEAVRQVLEPVFEPTFHPSSHGFRPGRSCHTAIMEACLHCFLTSCWTSSIGSLPGVVTNSFVMPMTSRCTCGASGRGSGSWPAWPISSNGGCV